MATSTPLSLQSKPDYLRNWMIARGSVPYNMLWTEVVDEGSQPFSEASANQCSAASMTFATPWSNYLNYGTDIYLSILGGWDEANGKMAPPFEWPFESRNAGMFATYASVRSRFLDNSISWSAGQPAPYRIAEYKITFQALPYNVNADQDGLTYNPNWIEFKTQATNEAFQSPAGHYVFTGTTATAINGTFIPYSSSYLEVVCHRLPASQVLNGGAGMCAVQPFIGSINSAAIFGCDAKTLLFDSLTIAPFGDWQGNNIYDVHLFFNFRENPWDQALKNDGTWGAIVTNNGGNAPLDTFDFAVDIFQTLIPANE